MLLGTTATGILILDLACGNLAERENNILVLAPVLNERASSLVVLLDPFGCQHHQQKTVLHMLQTIFDSNACHD